MHWLVALWWKQLVRRFCEGWPIGQTINNLIFFSTFKLKKQMLLVFQLSKKLWIDIALEEISSRLD